MVIYARRMLVDILYGTHGRPRLSLGNVKLGLLLGYKYDRSAGERIDCVRE